MGQLRSLATIGRAMPIAELEVRSEPGRRGARPRADLEVLVERRASSTETADQADDSRGSALALLLRDEKQMVVRARWSVHCAPKRDPEEPADHSRARLRRALLC